MFFKRRRKAEMSVSASQIERALGIGIRVVGVGGGGGNAVRRMVSGNLTGVRYLVLNTDIQALRGFDSVPTFAIGPNTTGGMGSGGQPAVGRKAMRESQKDVSKLLEGADMVFVAVGMGGGTGTGAASLVADLARKAGALTVGVATLPFGFEGPRRRENAEAGLNTFRQKVDTLIVVENDRLLPSLNGKIELERAFKLADEVLHQGVRGNLGHRNDERHDQRGLRGREGDNVRRRRGVHGYGVRPWQRRGGAGSPSSAVQSAVRHAAGGCEGHTAQYHGRARPDSWRGPPGGGDNQGRSERGCQRNLRRGTGQADEAESEA